MGTKPAPLHVDATTAQARHDPRLQIGQGRAAFCLQPDGLPTSATEHCSAAQCQLDSGRAQPVQRVVQGLCRVLCLIPEKGQRQVQVFFGNGPTDGQSGLHGHEMGQGLGRHGQGDEQAHATTLPWGLARGQMRFSLRCMNLLRRHPDYARLFAAQVVALTGTGLMSVALGLLAFDLAGAQAGLVLGMVYTLKMVAYVGLAPLAQAMAARLPRKTVLIVADLARLGCAAAMPFVTEVWQVYGLVFVLQAASATFTPAFQATLPDLLPEERDYTRALSLSRLAYDLENLTSPLLAGMMLLVMPFSGLFAGTALGFLISLLLLLRTGLPHQPVTHRPFRARLTRGLRLYLATPRLRGLLALNFCASALGAFVLVNTVVLVRDGYGAGEGALALAMTAFGAGSMLMALAMPHVLEHLSDRSAMLLAGVTLALFGLLGGTWLWVTGLPPALMALGFLAVLGAGYSGILTPGGRLLARSAQGEDRPALFAAQFALSHMGWLVTYPLAGYAGVTFGLGPTLVGMSLLGLAASVIAAKVWTS